MLLWPESGRMLWVHHRPVLHTCWCVCAAHLLVCLCCTPVVGSVSARCLNSTSSFPQCEASPPPRVCSFYCVLRDCRTQSLPHNMAHQACFHQPLGQEWRWRRAGLCLGALRPSSSFHLLRPTLPSLQCSPLFPSIIPVPQLLLSAP